MDENGPSTPEEVAEAEDDVITADASPKKAIDNLKAQMANKQPFDISSLGPTTPEAPKPGSVKDIRERLKTATEVKLNDPSTIPTNSKWFSKK